jgi:hypothetical protein
MPCPRQSIPEQTKSSKFALTRRRRFGGAIKANFTFPSIAMRRPAMKLFAITVAAALVLPTLFARAGEGDPLSTMQALKDAERAFDLDRALSLFADDAVIVNAAGATTAGMENLRQFLDEDMGFNDSFELNQPVVDHNQVSWTESVSADFYRKLGVAPVRFVFTAIVNQRKIELIAAHVPLEEIGRIEAARRRTTEPVIYGRPCSQYIRYLRHQTDALY